jgi:hypothetical protein
VAARRYSTDSDAILAAVQQVGAAARRLCPLRPPRPHARACGVPRAPGRASLCARASTRRVAAHATAAALQQTRNRQLAGPASGIGIVDTTKLAVNTLKVGRRLDCLDEIGKAPALPAARA